jgi:diguanylate cyclase (GGDEF)-like protein
VFATTIPLPQSKDFLIFAAFTRSKLNWALGIASSGAESSASRLATMAKFTPALSPSEPDPALLARLAIINRVWLAVVALIAIVTLAAWFIPPLGMILPAGWQKMRSDSAAAALFYALSLRFSEPRYSRRMHRVSLAIACLVTIFAAAKLAQNLFHVSLHIDALLPPYGLLSNSPLHGLTLQASISYTLLGSVIVLLPVRRRSVIYLSDALLSGLGFVVLVVASGFFFGATQLFGISLVVPTSIQTVTCLLLLTQVVFFRQASGGVFSIFLGRGIAGRTARILSPFVLLLPFLREAARARILGAGRMPAHYVTALLASLTAIIAMALLLYLAWQINGMETEIHDLSLRDALTGLYNLRGFHLLAEQALRLAQRSELPFSVLFVDLDNLKQVNDSLGHSEGSRFLVRTAELLTACFRETDVIGRVGGDEFAVAGQFTQADIAHAAQRLEELTSQRNAASSVKMTLSLSIGHVTSLPGQHESLHDMLAKADHAMYEEKRRKKIEGHSSRK